MPVKTSLGKDDANKPTKTKKKSQVKQTAANRLPRAPIRITQSDNNRKLIELLDRVITRETQSRVAIEGEISAIKRRLQDIETVQDRQRPLFSEKLNDLKKQIGTTCSEQSKLVERIDALENFTTTGQKGLNERLKALELIDDETKRVLTEEDFKQQPNQEADAGSA